ncbi:NAD(P)-binding domain-containing protein [Haliangium sp.]|uniref:NAD(P)-binding domain-containing protein n=1 Tax=Haliangium sp. TaxID=2663208 RepID=UPI003D0EE5B3
MSERARRAPRAHAPSDVRRFRGVGLAAALAAAGAALALVLLAGPDALRGSPGPLSPAHKNAGLACGSCHLDAEPAAGPGAACARCHGAVAMSRPGHHALAAAGRLGCPDCHRAHAGHARVALRAGAPPRLLDPAGAHELATAAAPWTGPDTTVAVVPAAACARCHDPADSRDPMAACLLAGLGSAGLDRPTVCFDEHAAPGTLAGPGGRGSRDAAWAHARAALAQVDAAAPTTGRTRLGPPVWLGLGGLAGLLGWLAVGARDRRRRAAAQAHAPEPVVEPPALRRLPVIDVSTCLGCYACVDACPYDALEIRRFVAVVARPSDCCGLALCAQRCPNGSLVMGDGSPREAELPIRDSLESERVPGLYLAGDITGLPLIRNAINQGAHAVRAIARDLAAAPRQAGPAPAPDQDIDQVVDLVIVGAGPAGISAALEAKAQGLRCAVLEQGSVAESIRSFPRGKLVFDQPLDMPMIGALWLRESTKEELLGKWLRIVRSERLDIREHHRVTAIDPIADPGRGFAIAVAHEDDPAEPVRARRVLVAIGRRGAPRRLAVDIPSEMAAHVHYSLADAASFAGQRVLVVGLGDVAMEAAVALSRQPGTEVTVSYRGPGARRGKARNIAALQRRAAAGAVTLRFGTEVTRVDPGEVELTGTDGPERVACDAVFVLIGADAPTAFLDRIGVRAGSSADAGAPDRT